MRLVVNTNRIIAALIKDSDSRRIILHQDHEFITIVFSEKELKKHKELILNKSGLKEEELDIILKKLKSRMIMIEDRIIETKMEKAKKIMDRIDPNDTPFIAAALATNSAIWTDDKHFKMQNKIKVYTTKDVINLK